LLRESCSKLPENPEIQYHVGMEAYKTGDKETPGRALTKAATSATSFAGKEEAKKALMELGK